MRRRLLPLLPALLLLAAAPPRGRAQTPCFDYATAGWPARGSLLVPGGASDVAATGDGHVLVATDLGVAVCAVTTGADPVMTDYLGTDAPVVEVATDGSVVAALTADDRLLTGVLSAPGRGDWSGSIALAYASRVAVDGGLVVVRQGLSQLATVDVSDPKEPRYLGWANMPESFNDLAVGEGLAFLASESSLLLVCSLADPAQPALVATAGRLASGTAVALEFPRVHLANVGKVISYDVSVPTEMVELGESSRLTGFTNRLAAGRGLCAALTTAGHVFNLEAPPDGPVAAVGQTMLAGAPVGVAVERGLVVAATADGRLQVLDPADGVHPDVVRESLGHLPSIVVAAGDLVYGLDEDHPLGARLTVAELGPPMGTADLGFLPFFGTPRALDVHGDRLVLATSFTSAALVDVSDPAAPRYLSQRGQDIATDDAVVLDDVVCALGRDEFGDETLVVYAVSPADVLQLTGALRMPYGSVQMVGWRGHAVVRGRFEMNGIMVVDCRDAHAARVTDWVGLPGTSIDLAVAGHHAYLLAADGTLHVVDLADTGALQVVASLALGAGAGAGSLAVVGNALLVTDTTRGLTVVDISAPSAPSLAGAAWLPVTGQVVAGPAGVLLNDAQYRQRSHLPPLCGALSGSGIPAAAPLLLTALPNPFNPRTTLVFTLADPAAVTLEIFDLAGRRVRTLLADAPLAAGTRRVAWDGRDDAGAPLASSVYLARLRHAGGAARAKLVLVR